MRLTRRTACSPNTSHWTQQDGSSLFRTKLPGLLFKRGQLNVPHCCPPGTRLMRGTAEDGRTAAQRLVSLLALPLSYQWLHVGAVHPQHKGKEASVSTGQQECVRTAQQCPRMISPPSSRTSLKHPEENQSLKGAGLGHSWPPGDPPGPPEMLPLKGPHWGLRAGSRAPHRAVHVAASPPSASWTRCGHGPLPLARS